MILVPLIGPLAIQAYGLCIVLGLLTFSFFLRRDELYSLSGLKEHFTPMLSLGIYSGVIFGRIGYLLTSSCTLSEFFCFWLGGYSILASIIGIVLSLSLYSWYYRVSIMSLDRVAVYAPLWHAIARIGCFLAGCCYGKPTQALWAVTYTHKNCAPQGIPLHPTQLYSSLFFVILFLLFYIFLRKRPLPKGYLLGFYLTGLAVERFSIDFWRADRIFYMKHSLFSIHQYLALIIALCALLWLTHIWIKKRVYVN